MFHNYILLFCHNPSFLFDQHTVADTNRRRISRISLAHNPPPQASKSRGEASDTTMIDQDYAELLSRTPPSGEVLEWTFSTRSVASAFAALLLGTPALCTALYSSGLSGSSDPREGAELRVRPSGRRTLALLVCYMLQTLPMLFLIISTCMCPWARTIPKRGRFVDLT